MHRSGRWPVIATALAGRRIDATVEGSAICCRCVCAESDHVSGSGAFLGGGGSRRARAHVCACGLLYEPMRCRDDRRLIDT
eukprot:3819429-Prymnesium_polylepis.2